MVHVTRWPSFPHKFSLINVHTLLVSTKGFFCYRRSSNGVTGGQGRRGGGRVRGGGGVREWGREE